MATFWQIVQPTIWAPDPDCYECEVPDYGPRRIEADITRAHHGVWYEKVEGVAVYTCSCGWRDLEMNYRAHLSEMRRAGDKPEYLYR